MKEFTRSILIAVVAGLVGAVIGSTLVAQAKEKPITLMASELFLTDEKGDIQITLSAVGGKPTILIGNVDDRALALSVGSDGPDVFFRDPKYKMHVGADKNGMHVSMHNPDGLKLLMGVGDSPYFIFPGQNSTMDLLIGTTASTGSFIEINRSGKDSWRVP